jgi:uncharacterized protein YdeI (YjbR/CyaY-like superfamily)
VRAEKEIATTRERAVPTIDPRIDAYIAKSAEFAQPILAELRARVHKACPDTVETLKWSMPTFMYGKKILCGMAAFKQHATFGFWQREVAGESAGKEYDAMGQFGRIASIKDVPGKREFAEMVKRAMEQIDSGVKAPPKLKHAKPPLEVPDYFLAALKKSKKALATFEGFSPSNKREYVEWITEAKAEVTRARRLAQAVEWMAEGKVRNWKYLAC